MLDKASVRVPGSAYKDEYRLESFTDSEEGTLLPVKTSPRSRNYLFDSGPPGLYCCVYIDGSVEPQSTSSAPLAAWLSSWDASSSISKQGYCAKGGGKSKRVRSRDAEVKLVWSGFACLRDLRLHMIVIP